MPRSDYPILILTLEGDEKRRAPLLAQLDALGLGYELFFGVNGRAGLAEQYERMIDRKGTLDRVWRKLSDGEYACALSHQEIYRTILDEGWPGAIVLEDDAVLQPGFADFVRAGVYRRHAMVLLDHLGGRHLPFRPEPLMPGVAAWRVAVPPWLTTGYTVSRGAAETIRRRALPLRATADWPCNIARLDCVALLPRLVRPPEDPLATSHLAAERTRNLVRPKYARFRGLFSADKWFDRVARRIGRPFDMP